MKKLRYLFFVGIVGFLFLGIGFPYPSAGVVFSNESNSKVQTALSNLAKSLPSKAKPRPSEIEIPLTAAAQPRAEAGVVVILEVKEGQLDKVSKAVAKLALVDVSSKNSIQAIVLPESLRKFISQLANFPGVEFIRLPFPIFPTIIPLGTDWRLPCLKKITSQGVELIGATPWHNEEWTGRKVKIGIIDRSFTGYKELLDTELPSSSMVETKSFWKDNAGNDSMLGDGSGHGTAVAEIVHDMAPAAKLYLVCIRAEKNIKQAVDWLIEQEVDIINTSWAVMNGRYDGESEIDKQVARAQTHGILWVTAAGNYARTHWEGDWQDDDGNGWLNLSSRDETIAIQVQKGEDLRIGLNWNDPWDNSSNDYNVFLYMDKNNDRRLSESEIVAFSTDKQEGDAHPFEYIKGKVNRSGIYHIVIKKVKGAKPKHLELFTYNHNLQYKVASSSLMTPASSPDALTVGATDLDDHLRDYSSRGPTNDGRTKPELIAPDGVRTKTYSTFDGTSASAPHVAGAMALLKQAYSSLVMQAHSSDSSGEIQEYLEDRAEDLGPLGRDNSFGSGRIDLGRSPEVERPLAKIVHVPEDVPNVQLAIDAVKEGGTVRIAAGTYQENLWIHKSLTLQGVNAKRTAISHIEIAPEEKSISVKIVQLEINEEVWIPRCDCGPCLEPAVPDRGVEIGANSDYSSSQVKIKDCIISENEIGIKVWRGPSQVEINGSIISENALKGIDLEGEEDLTQLKISKTIISENYTGISMEGFSQAEIRNNKIFDNGFGVEFDSKGKIEGGENEIYDNGEDVWPDDLEFLMTEEGGCYGPLCT